MEPQSTTAINLFTSEKVKKWFDDLVATIRKDQIILQTGIASEEKEKMYKTFIIGNEEEVNSTVRATNSMYFIKNLVLDYFNELMENNLHPNKLALDLSGTKILVWAEINDNDEETESALILCEAKVNSKYFKYDFNITSTIVEKSDNLEIPPHYQDVLKD